jgi:1-deoxy-D-xylulose-5-phosphate synthase
MSRILDQINSPADLKGLTLPQLKQLATEIRQELIAVVSANGGHLASNLGVVELTLALHRVFDSPRDKIIWDVGHQSYVHKLLTGRRERFFTLRQYRGLSGFPDPEESPHDVFGTGHASTSISAALGMAVARDLAGEDYQVIAVIGDGALTGGMALEGLNQAGQLGTRLIVILNDNGMSISPSVGALSRLLHRVRLDRRYHWAKREVEEVLARIPLGGRAWRMSQRVKDSFKTLLLPTMIWEELGFTYIGPVNGHNIGELEEALSRAKSYYRKPTFLHVLTRKGKGYPPAERDAVTFHGLTPEGGKKAALSYSQVLGQTVLRLMQKDSRVVAITAGMAEGTGLSAVMQEFPYRVFDVGICEQHAVTFAAGMATQGFVPIVAIYSTFLQRALDQVVHDVCLQNLPVVFAVDRSGIVGEDGKTHQGTFDLSLLGCVPHLVLCSPRDENELQHLLYTAVRSGCPVAVRYPRGGGSTETLDPEFKEIPLGKGEVLWEGDMVAIVAIGSAVAPSLEAARWLEEKGVSCRVVNARFAKPLDEQLLRDTAARIKRLVTVEENTVAGGFGSAVLRLLQGSDVQVRCLGLPEEFIEHGSQGLLRTQYLLDAPGIAQQILSAFPELAHHLPAGAYHF